MTESRPEVPRRVVDLVRDAQRGDHRALAQLVAAELPGMYQLVGRALGGHADVDDVVQEAVLQVMRSLPALRDPQSFRAWVLAIARRQILVYLRTRRKDWVRRQDLAVDLPDPGGDFADRTIIELTLRAQRRELTEAVRWLDDDDRVLLSLWWQEVAGELTRTELALAVGVAPAHAAVRLKRMRDQLDAARLVVRALRAGGCGQLVHLTRHWDGRPDALWRKRLVRHTRDCATCGSQRHGLLPLDRLLPGLLALPLPPALAAACLAAVKGHLVVPAAHVMWRSVIQYLGNLAHHKAVVAASVVTLVAGGGFAYSIFVTPERTGPPAAAASPAVPTPAAPVQVAPSPPGESGSPVAPSRSSGPPAVLPVTGVTVADIYVAPNGSDTGDGSIAHPYATIAKAVAAVRPGQTIAVRGGTYRPTAAVTISTSGDAGHRIVLSNYRNERPVIDAAAVPPNFWMFTQHGNYWTVQGLEIRNSGSHAYVCVSCEYDVFQRLSIHDNVRSGLTLRGDGTVGNQVLDSDFYDNHDPASPQQTGIGLGIKFGSGTGNVVRGNRAFDNADNGFDLGTFASPVTLEYNWAYGNGLNHWHMANWHNAASGFALGGGAPAPAAAHVLHDNAAWNNSSHGFSDDENPGKLQLTRNTAWHNSAAGFSLTNAAGILHGNASVDNSTAVALDPAATATSNTWNGNSAATAAMFRSTDSTTAQGARQADGTLPATTFLTNDGSAGASMRE